MIDIAPKDFETVKTILKQYVPEYRVVVFGSRAKKTAKRRSDLDLCLMGTNPLPIGHIAALEDAFSSSDLDFKVDVVDWARIQTSFRNIIEKDSLVIQESKMAHSELNQFIDMGLEDMSKNNIVRGDAAYAKSKAQINKHRKKRA